MYYYMPEEVLTPLEFWTYSTMLIDNQWGGHGTGFLVQVPLKDDNTQARVFLVTNKHVINPDHVLRKTANKINLHFNIKDKEDQSIIGQNLTFEFSYSEKCREHSGNDVDVLAFEITELFVRYPEIEAYMANYNMFSNQTVLKELDIKMGDEIVVIGFPQGYPLGLKHITSNHLN
jgi:hypothetical protein